MSNNTEAIVSVEDYDEESDYGPDDFGFVIGPDGGLKSFMIPEHLMDDPPPEILMILEIFGIENIHELDASTSTLH
jgi:hypothetical protein